MNNILQDIGTCVEFGKVDVNSTFPAFLRGKDGVVELLNEALDAKIAPVEILNSGLLVGMGRVGEKFRDGKIFLPEVLIAAKAMNKAMEILKPYFLSGEIKHKGKVILGTVSGDLHDIGKNIVKMVLEGSGWEIIDLGIDVSAEKFLEAIKKNNVSVIGLSALLTTTMQNMEGITKKIKTEFPSSSVIIGGAPVSKKFSEEIGADNYFPDPHTFLAYLNKNYSSNEI